MRFRDVLQRRIFCSHECLEVQADNVPEASHHTTFLQHQTLCSLSISISFAFSLFCQVIILISSLLDECGRLMPWVQRSLLVFTGIDLFSANTNRRVSFLSFLLVQSSWSHYVRFFHSLRAPSIFLLLEVRCIALHSVQCSFLFSTLLQDFLEGITKKEDWIE
jgi:hypothetical protein